MTGSAALRSSPSGQHARRKQQATGVHHLVHLTQPRADGLVESIRDARPPARRTLAAAQDGQDAVAAVRGLLRGQLRIGVIQELGLVNLPAVLARYRRRHPGVALELRHGNVPALIEATLTGRLDLAFVDHPLGDHADRVHARTLGTEALVLAVAAADPLAGRRHVRLPADTSTISALATDPTIHRELAVVTATERAPTPAATALLDLL